MSPVTVPEKTLEHWASQYVAYRYRSKASLWWPAAGEDIDVRSLPLRPGKAIQLEMKTATVSGTSFQDVSVDLGQLWDYHQRPLGRQPFYAFPWPFWSGGLEPAAARAGLGVTAFGVSRSRSWWFARWMVVLTTRQVAAILSSELAKHGSRDRGVKQRLVRLDTRCAPQYATDVGVTWGSGAAAPQMLRWLDFWAALDRCGEVGWPQLIRVPRQLFKERSYDRQGVLGLLRNAGESYGDDLITLEPDVNGQYRISETLMDGRRPDGDRDGVEDRRLVVFVDAAKIGHA
jgi:hypothetical protein